MSYLLIYPIILNFVLMFVSGMTYPILPLFLAGNLGEGVIIAGIVTSSASLLNMVFSIIFGHLSDIIGDRRPFILLGLGLLTLFYLLAGIFSWNIIAMCIFYALAGMGSAAIFVGSIALASDLSNMKTLGKSMGFFWASGSFGWALALVFAGLILKKLGIQGIFIFSALSTFITFLIGIKPILHGLKYIDKNNRDKDSRNRVHILTILRRLNFLVLYISSLIFFVGDVIKNIYVPQFYVYVLGIDTAFVTTALSLASWCEIPFIMFFGPLIDKIGAKQIYVFSLLSMSLYLGINTLVSSLLTTFIAMSLYGFVWASYSTASSVLAALLVSEDEKGTAFGLINSNFHLANILMNPILSYLVVILGYKDVFLMMAITSMLMTIAIEILIKPIES